METKISLITAVVIVFAFAGQAGADIVELDLFTIGCHSTYDFNSPEWTSDFDLGVPFTEISHVYIDWSGEITAGLAIEYDNPDEPFPLSVGVYTSLGSNPYIRVTEVWGGMYTYPAAESFDCISEIELILSSTWSDLLDGQGSIKVGYTELIILNGKYVEHGSIALDSATLVVEGIIVPEPATFVLFGLGGLLLRNGENLCGILTVKMV